MTTDAFTPPSDAALPLRLLPHALRPVPLLAQEMLERFLRAFGGHALHLNGYSYVASGGGAPAAAALEPSPYDGARDAWERHALPRIREICEALWSEDYERWPLEELAQALPGYFAEAARAFAYTMQPLPLAIAPANALLAFCEERFGPGGDRLVATLLQGFENDSLTRGLAMEELARLLRASPALLAAARDGDLTAAREAPGGKAFSDAFEACLETYGHGSQTWWELHEPAWGEHPGPALRLLAGFAPDPARGPAAAHARARAERVETTARCEAELPDDDARTRFRSLLAGAADYVFVIEGRAHWQQNCVGALRPACLVLGRQLAARGALATPEDVFHLSLDELSLLAMAASPPLRETVDARKADCDRWAALDPPLTIGHPPPEAPAPVPNFSMLMFGGPAERSDDPALLKGVGASPGTVRGRARVVFSIADAERLQPGDVLVCPFTSPAWTPLFAMAGAIVTDRGGVLSHAAIEAREYALPCVVGTETGTRSIPDGATVTVDGLAGTVRIHAG